MERHDDGSFRNREPRLQISLYPRWMESSFRCAKRSHVGRWWLHSSRFHVQPASTLFPFCKDSMKRTEIRYGNTHITIVGISQNEKKDTAAFIKQYGLTFPVLLDDTSTYEVSNAYGLTNVPTIFWIAQDGEIEVSSVGWVRKDMDRFQSARRRALRMPPPSRYFIRASRSPTSALVEGRKTSPRSRARNEASDLRTQPRVILSAADRFATRIGLRSRRTPTSGECCSLVWGALPVRSHAYSRTAEILQLRLSIRSE